jgi:hypothetical protein
MSCVDCDSYLLGDTTLRRSPPRITVDDLPRPVLPEPNAVKSPAPAVVVECWCLMVRTINRSALDKFTRETWKKFDAKDLEPVKWATLGRQRVLTMCSAAC